MKIETLLTTYKTLYYKIKHKIEINKYDNFTIAEYFRKQGAQIGEGCYISIRDLCTEPYLVRIGNHVLIAEGVVFHTHDGATWIFREKMPWLRVFGPIIVEDNCIIGQNASLLPNIVIGENSIVGTGSVVISDVPPNSIVMGVPARRIGSVQKYKEKCLDRWELQKPPDAHPDFALPFWEKSKNSKLILEQLREHLTKVFFNDKSKYPF